MVTMAEILRRIKACAGRRPRRFAPEVAALETRTLQTVNDGLTKVWVHPGVLPPTSSGHPIPVHVYGTISSNVPKVPRGYFFVTDEYRSFEPSGPVALKLVGSKTYGKMVWYDYGYSFEVDFPTKRSTNTPDGRHYSLFVGAEDSDGNGGLTVQVLVPKTYRPVHVKSIGAKA